MRNEKHRVLIFGEKTFGTEIPNITSDLYDVEVVLFPYDNKYVELRNLSDYTLVILDYSAFQVEHKDVFTRGSSFEHIHREEQDIFEKQISQALDSGTCFCFLYYDQDVPEHGTNSEDSKRCRESQIGFRWLQESGIGPRQSESLITRSQLRRNEFKNYIDRWGASKLYFRPYSGREFSDIIAGFGEGNALAFTLDFSKGKLIYMPCQRDSRLWVLREMIETLIDNLITYLAKSRTELPKWAQEPIFDEEEKLWKEKSDLEVNLKAYQEKLDVFNPAKHLLFQSEYGLEKALTEFLREQCQIPIEREENYREDFWLIDPELPPEEQRIAICEIKSYSKGFKKGGLFSLYGHRESYALPEDFPAILFVNANLNTASWKQKDRPIDKQDYEEATRLRILIVRIEDLLFAWQALRENSISKSGLLDIFRKEIGWLNFRKDGSRQVLK